MHRFLALILLLGSAVPAPAQPEPVDTLFQRGNDAYAAGHLTDALNAYQQILDAGMASVALYHNMGNAYLQRGDVGRAVQAYAKGLQLAPGHRRLVHNLQQARDRAGLSGRVPVLERGGQSFAVGGSVGWLAVLGWGCVAAGLGLAVYRAAPDRSERIITPTVMGLVAGGLVVWILSLGLSVLQTPDRRAVVLAAEVPVHASPSDTASATATVREGMVLAADRSRDAWTRVRLRDGTQGWVRTEWVGPV
jgi:hypothetical protein